MVNGYDDAARLKFLPARLDGTAYRVFQSVRTANSDADFSTICTLLTAQFEPPQQRQLHEAEFRVREKRAHETQIVYAAALRSLANRAFPGQDGPLLERMILQRFIDGQPSVEVRHSLCWAACWWLFYYFDRAVGFATVYAELFFFLVSFWAVMLATVFAELPVGDYFIILTELWGAILQWAAVAVFFVVILTELWGSPQS